MKSLNFVKTFLILCFSLLTFSCQNDQELLEDTNTIEPVEIEEENEITLATFNFANGNSLTMSKGYEDSEPYITTTQSGSLDNKILIDFKNNSLLQVYLLLTPEKTPIPKVLIDLASLNDKAKLLSDREIVENLQKLVFDIKEQPISLITSISSQKTELFCDEMDGGVKECTNSSYLSSSYQSHKLTGTIGMYTEVFLDSPGFVEAGLTVGKRRRKHSEHIIQPGYWARRSRHSVLLRKRGSFRYASGRRHWRGYTYIF